MGEFTQFLWAMVDSTRAALIGLNLVPVIVFGLFVGMIFRRGRSWLKAPLAVIPALIVAGLWPVIYGADAIWPDFNQIETGIQTLVLYGVAWAIVAGVGFVKRLMSPIDLRRPPVIVPIISES
ncbi:hypothetical protein [Asticcacaulis solisilvae]|uniref:hypothetical protein n=1 Tax=Asticcacaulis solisilvae TaxID=1217274 RepID=UPI003FD8921B